MSLTWLHVSDFHFRSGDPYDRNTVLRALLHSVRRAREQDEWRADLVFATGDIAFSGKAAEYALATQFFDDLLEAVDLPKQRLFVVPGNHDVDRDQGFGLFRTLGTEEDSGRYFRPGKPLLHLNQRMQDFVAWYDCYFAGIRNHPQDSSCGPIELVEIRGHRLAILPLNSALFCVDNHDHEQLWLGRRCLSSAIEQLQALNAELRIGLVHHPLDWISGIERPAIKAGLRQHLDLLLRGHLHDAEAESTTGTHGALLELAAGAAYQTRKWPNRAFWVRWDDPQVLLNPITYVDLPQEAWTLDTSVFAHEPGYVKRFDLARRVEASKQTAQVPAPPIPATPASAPAPASPAPAPPIRSGTNVPTRGDLPIVGREALLEQIATHFADTTAERVLVLHGAPGVGKSELSREYARRQGDRYPGGRYVVPTGGGSELLELACVGSHYLGLDFSPDLPLQDRAQRTLLALGRQPTLLVYDNVTNPEALRLWMPRSGMRCHVLLTTLDERLGLEWPDLLVPPLAQEHALELIRSVAGADILSSHGIALASMAGGLPVQIIPACKALKHSQLRRRLSSVTLTITDQAQNSFAIGYDLLGAEARLLLHAAARMDGDRLQRRELRQVMLDLQWSEARFDAALDRLLDLHQLEGGDTLSLHQLLAAYVHMREDRACSDLARLDQVLQGHFLGLATAVATTPSDRTLVQAFLSHPLAFETWRNRAGLEWTYIQASQVGRGLYRIGQFLQALDWLEWVEAEIGQDDVRGQVDRESLGACLHEIGYRLSSQAQFAEAQPWFERAVSVKERGDMNGRVDYVSLSVSLHEVGSCLSGQGRLAEARPWFERAVAEAERGDVDGRVDHGSIGLSLHQVGYCLSSQGRLVEAQSWLERAVLEVERGDRIGRVDLSNLRMALYSAAGNLEALGRPREAAALRARADRLDPPTS